MPARRLAGDPALAERTRERSPAAASAREAESTTGTPGAVEAFLADEAKIEAIQQRAREEAERRAVEWDLG